MDTRRNLLPPERAVVEAELASAISDVTAGLMAIHGESGGGGRGPGSGGGKGGARGGPPSGGIDVDILGDGGKGEIPDDELTELPLDGDEPEIEFVPSSPDDELDPHGDSEPLELDLEPLDEVGSGDSSGIRPGQRVVFGTAKPPPAVQISFRPPGARPTEPPAVSDLDDTKQRMLAARRVAQGRAPTQDPTLLSGGIDVHDTLLQLDQPTSDYSHLASLSPPEDRKTAELARGLIPDLAELGEAQTRLGNGDDYDDIAGELLAGISLDPPGESKDARIRRRVSALIDRASSLLRDGNFMRAVVAVDLALQEDPESAAAQKVIHRHRDLLLDIYRQYIGNLEHVPALAVPMHELKLHEINHRAAFLLSRIDGVLSFEEVLATADVPPRSVPASGAPGHAGHPRSPLTRHLARDPLRDNAALRVRFRCSRTGISSFVTSSRPATKGDRSPLG